MEKVIHKLSLFVFGLLVTTQVHAAEITDPAYANTQRICQCLQEGKDRNCNPLNSNNNDDGNRGGDAHAHNAPSNGRR